MLFNELYFIKELKWLLDKLVPFVTKSRSPPVHAENELRERVGIIFSS